MNCKRCNGSGKEQDNKAIGRAMRVLRETANRSLSETAARMGMVKSYLCELELGRRRWNNRLVKRFIKAL